MMADAGAAYMALSADEATSIVSASVPVDIAARVELHETVPVEGDDAMGDDMDDSTDSAEEGDDSDVGDAMGDMAMTMQQVTSIDIPAGGEAVLEPGGLHIMLLELAAPLEEGETFEITLVTADGTEVVVPVEVRTDAP
jgi:copper(I)-binding protein